jgi:hypothetical protein
MMCNPESCPVLKKRVSMENTLKYGKGGDWKCRYFESVETWGCTYHSRRKKKVDVEELAKQMFDEYYKGRRTRAGYYDRGQVTRVKWKKKAYKRIMEEGNVPC